MRKEFGRVPGALAAAAILSLAGSAAASKDAPQCVQGQTKYQFCHLNKNNPKNFNTITVSDADLCQALANGDMWGPCAKWCFLLCDDGNPCTDDSCDKSDKCVPPSQRPVCNDSNACTADICDPVNGCSNPETVFCGTGNTCDSNSGQCVPNVCASTAVGEYPWYVELTIGSKHCGGSLISSGWSNQATILTAASCLFDANGNAVNANSVGAVVGSTNYVASSFIIHPMYNSTPGSNNLALVVIPTTGSIVGGNVQLAALPAYDAGTYAGNPGTTLGYGTCGPASGPTPQRDSLTVLTTADCNNQMGGGITDLNICINDPSGGGSCASEEGAPVHSGPANAVVGVQGPCAGTASGKPIVSARVSSYLFWININTP
jgi:hypothetical protein